MALAHALCPPKAVFLRPCGAKLQQKSPWEQSILTLNQYQAAVVTQLFVGLYNG